jgi:hypothetical protein
MFISTVKGVPTRTAAKFFGFLNLDEGSLFLGAVRPIVVGLHEPVRICWPLVRGKLTVAQKLMKLFSDVGAGVVFASGPSSGARPLRSSPGCTSCGRRFNEV